MAYTEHDTATRDRMRAEHAAQMLQAVADGTLEAHDKLRNIAPCSIDVSLRISAAKALIPYGKPMLSSVESSTVSPLDSMSAAELQDFVLALVRSKPELLAPLRDALSLPQSPQSSIDPLERPSQAHTFQPNSAPLGADSVPKAA